MAPVGAQGEQAARYDDFIAVAEDLIARKFTTPAHLGIEGGSNGGLLVGVMVERTRICSAPSSCKVPLLDMRRYHQAARGRVVDGRVRRPRRSRRLGVDLRSYCPYQNVTPDAKYPPMLFTTSTRDDRVHPGHARKMAARML